MTEQTAEPVNILDRIAKGEDLTAIGSELPIGVEVQRVKHIPLLPSVERMRSIFEDVIMQRAPKDPALRKMLTEQGTHIDPTTKRVVRGHRIRIEQGYLPIEGYVGQVTESQFACFTVPMLIDKSNDSNFYSVLQKHIQPGGEWVPLFVQTSVKSYPTLNGRVPADEKYLARDPGFPRSDVNANDEVVEWIIPPGPRVTEVAADAMFYAIVWVDLKNAPDDDPLDANGRPVPRTNVTVNTGTDPALIKVLEKLSERPAQAQEPVDSGLGRLVDQSGEVERLRAELAKAQADAKAKADELAAERLSAPAPKARANKDTSGKSE